MNGTRFRRYPLINHGLGIVDDPSFIPSDGIENVGVGNERLQLSFLDDIRDQKPALEVPQGMSSKPTQAPLSISAGKS